MHATIVVVMHPDDATHDDSANECRDADQFSRPFLVVAFECGRPLAGATRVDLEGVERVLIGRGEQRSFARSSDPGPVTLNGQVPGRSMSGSHARLVRNGSQWAIDDLGSTNGIFVNGARTRRAVISEQDVIEVGHTILLLRSAVARPVPDAHEDVQGPDAMPVTLNADFARRLLALERLAPSMVPVLILGESGVGKEVVARALHAASNRKGLFVGVNCGAIPKSLVESQLFGHVRGAFSGAVRDEPGFVRSADRGTLFLDEIADLPRASQAALLRVLQEREVIPIGTTRPVKVDLRFVAATHQSLATLVARGSFRHDLFARLAGYTLTVCPLRERKEDIGMLVPSILRKLDAERAPRVTFTPAAGRALFAHDWPFNVRELEHALAAAMVLAPDLRIDANHLGASVLGEIEMTDAPSDREPQSPAGDCD